MQIIVENLLINYKDSGKGPILLLLHGWGTNLESFNQISEDLQANYRVIRLDLPGFGQSQKPKEDWNVLEYAQFIQKFTQKLGATDIFGIIGHSFGCRVAIKALGNKLIQPRRAILIGAAGIKTSQLTKNKFYKALAKTGKLFFSMPLISSYKITAKKKFYTTIDSTDYIEAGSMKNIFLKTINEDLTEDAKKITTPTLFIWGKDDGTTPPSLELPLAQAVKKVQIKIVNEAGHYAHLDQPQQIIKLTRDFLNV